MSITEAQVKFSKGQLSQSEYVTYLRSQKLTREQILSMVAAKSLPVDVGLAMLEEADKLTGKGGLYLKVSEKGAISVYGLQRMPVTLYVEQWERLIGFVETLKEFITANTNLLTRKDRTPKA